LNPDEMAFLSLDELGRCYRDRALSPVEATRAQLNRIERFEPRLNAFRLVDETGALAAAQASEARWLRGEPLGSLDGMPVTVKDNVDLAGFPTRHGSTTTSETPAAADAPVVARLREAGAVFLGKTNLPEFGWTGFAESRLHGITRNPWNVAHGSGGSSGGAAAALAAGIGVVAFGNDGGGSIRGPASFCGVYGMKPTFGRVPHTQETVFATLVAGGPLARSVADAARTLAVMARPDDRDFHAAPAPPVDWLALLAPRLADLRIAWSPDLGSARPDHEVAATTAAAIAALRANGAMIETVGPIIAPLRPVFERFWIAGFARRLRSIPSERWDEIDPGFRRLAEQGLEVGIDEVLQAEAARVALYRRFADLHRKFDILLTPTMPHAAPLAETVYHTPAYDRWDDGIPYTLPFNLTGQPAASIPCGVTSDGLPVGLQVIGARFAERLVLEASLGIEAALAIPAPSPPLSRRLQALN